MKSYSVEGVKQEILRQKALAQLNGNHDSTQDFTNGFIAALD